ncbi:MAG: type II toxin-antitoxin system RelE/ParE family toxin [Thermodesulfobacteriota bacterium]
MKNLTTCRNVETLKDEDYDYRLRVGRYRVLFDYAEVIKIIYIQEVKKRDDRTY